jgi:hypothetical protein
VRDVMVIGTMVIGGDLIGSESESKTLSKVSPFS